MISICPTVTADNPDTFHSQMQLAAHLSGRIHLDVTDGQLAPRELLPLADVWWPGACRVDIHMMFERPLEHMDVLLALKPALVIAHAEGKGSFVQFSNNLRANGIQAGVALLPQTPVSTIANALDYVDHVLIFSGNLGYQGGSAADLSLLQKVVELKRLKPQLEIGWDGGVNDQNICQLVDGGIEVANVGGFLQSAANQQTAYNTLTQLANR